MKIKEMLTQRVLSPTQISLGNYVINPYRGCEFCCVYCYGLTNQNIKKRQFFSNLEVKVNAPDVLETELRYTNPRRVLLGSTTECFPAQELKYHVTEKILKILNKHHIPYVILSKSTLIQRYLSIISSHPDNTIYFTINLASNALIKLLEKNSPQLEPRLRTLEAILKRQIRLRVHIGPFIPYVSSLEAILQVLPAHIQEIDVELYHPKQGNFAELTDRIETHFGSAISRQLRDIYKTKESYALYAQRLKEEIERLKAERTIKVFYIVPNFDEYYTPYIDYENAL